MHRLAALGLLPLVLAGCVDPTEPQWVRILDSSGTAGCGLPGSTLILTSFRIGADQVVELAYTVDLSSGLVELRLVDPSDHVEFRQRVSDHQEGNRSLMHPTPGTWRIEVGCLVSYKTDVAWTAHADALRLG